MSNTILAQMRRFGVFSSEKEMADADNRPRLLRKLPRSRLLREDIELLWVKYDSQVQQTDIMGDWLERNAQGEPTIQRFVKVPGIRWIRAATFFAYVDTPWRFHKKQDLWKYTGIGLERSHSGCGPTQVHVAQYANRRLRGVLLGAAKTAIRTESNPFYDHYQRWTQKEGISVPNARRNTARSLAATLWGMWKNGSEYRPELVAIGGKTADTLASSQ